MSRLRPTIKKIALAAMLVIARAKPPAVPLSAGGRVVRGPMANERAGMARGSWASTALRARRSANSARQAGHSSRWASMDRRSAGVTCPSM